MFPNSKHLILKFSSEVIGQNFLKENLFLPKRDFPQSFAQEVKNGIIFGYFLSFQDDLNLNLACQLIKNDKYHELISFNADFLMIYCNFSSQSLFAVNSLSGKFPLYFGEKNKSFILSTDFSEVKRQLDKLSLNKKMALDFLGFASPFILTTDTIVKEIQKLPPGTLLTIANSGWQIKSLLDLKNLTHYKETEVVSREIFQEKFINVLKGSIKVRLEKLGSLNYITELSSGFDSSLISYLVKTLGQKSFKSLTAISPHFVADTDPSIVQSFAIKHGLEVEYFDESRTFPFSEIELNFIKNKFGGELGNVARADIFAKRAVELGAVGYFQGVGGDEVYGSYFLEEHARFQIQYAYYYAFLNLFNTETNCLFTQVFLDALKDKTRFQEKDLFPTPYGVSIVVPEYDTFPVYWENGVWPLDPFVDLRVIKTACGVPRINDSIPDKREIWKGRTDIFLPSQFRPPGHMDDHFKLYVEKRTDFLIKVLENSIFGKMGWIKNKEILDDMRNNKLDKYLKTAFYLHRIIKLEYFLQENGVIEADKSTLPEILR